MGEIFSTSLLQPIRRILAQKRRELAPDHVVVGSAILPAKHLRFGGKEFKNDNFFLDSARREARRLVDRCGLTSADTVLDIGCGVGRLPIGILKEIGPIRMYQGLDIDARSIRWCREHIQHTQPRFEFLLLDVHNGCYNPDGSPLDDFFRMPFPDAGFDIIYLYSVFSHMLPEDIRIYLREYRRLLAEGGKIFLTAFVEDGVPDIVENPPHYRMKWKGPLHCVRLSTSFFSALVREAGFQIADFDYAHETDGQSGIYLVRSE